VSLKDEEVLHVARLSAIEVSEEEIPQLKQDLNEVLEYMDSLSSVSTRGVRPTSHVHGAVNAFRDDLTKESLTLDATEQNAPDFNSNGFRVPKVL
jgi:aspartyl-tRNA(Asn)/glutamyl-tRNA(Gln) amidotransferase subunit C